MASTQGKRHDLVTLLDDPRAARAEITSKESGWLRSISGRLSIDDPPSARTSSHSPPRWARLYRMPTA